MITLSRFLFTLLLFMTGLVSMPAWGQRQAYIHAKKQQLAKIQDQVAAQTQVLLVRKGDINITLSNAFLAKTTATLGNKPQATRTTRLTLTQTENSLYQDQALNIDVRLDQLFAELVFGKPSLQSKHNALNLSLPLTLSAKLNATVHGTHRPLMASGSFSLAAAPPLKLVPTPKNNESYGFTLRTDGPQSLTGILALDGQGVGSFSTTLTVPLPEEPLAELRLPGLIAKQVSLKSSANNNAVNKTWLVETTFHPIVFKPSGISIAVCVSLNEITPPAAAQ